MKSSLKVFLAFAILSNALCLDLGRLLGLRRDWRDSSSHPEEPQIVEVVRWRQPVCVVPGPGVPPCLVALRKHQNEYEKNSAKGIETNERERPLNPAEAQKTNKNEMEEALEKFASKKTNRVYGVNSSREELIEEYCAEKMENANSGVTDSKKSTKLIRIVAALREMGVSKEGDDSGAIEELCSELVSSPKVVSPRVLESAHVESVDRVELESSEGSLALNLRSSTPGLEEARAHRQGKYLMIAEAGKSAPTTQKPPAIYVTKVLNSPVTATLVADNCFPDIGVPLCDEYQETLTIYERPVEGLSASEIHEESAQQVALSSQQETLEESVVEKTEATDFWNDPNNPNFDDGTASSRPERPSGLLGQAVQHVLNKPGVVSAIPTEVLQAFANNPAVIEALVNSGESTANVNVHSIVTATKPQTVTELEGSEGAAQATTSKPGFISSLLDIQRPAIFDSFWKPGFGIFDKNTTARPETTETVTEGASSTTDGHFGSGMLGQGQVVEAIQNLVHKPDVINTNDKLEFQPVLVIEPPKKSGLFEHLWNPAGGFGIFDKHSTTTTTGEPAAVVTTEEPNVFTSAIGGSSDPQPKPTQAPGIFGGLFSNPSKPQGFDESPDSAHGILGIGSSIFQHTSNKPLVVERPGAKPLLVEKPIYIQEKPPTGSGLLNFFIPASNKPLLNVEHEVIREPVYVYQKPQTASGILSNVFGTNDEAPSKPAFFQGWAILGNHDKKSSEKIKSNESEEDAQGGQKETKISEEPSASTAIDRQPTVQAIEEASSTSIADVIPEAIASLQTSTQSAIPLEDNAQENDSSDFIAEGALLKGTEETVSSLHNIIEDEVKEADVAIGAEAIPEDSEKEEAQTSEPTAEETTAKEPKEATRSDEAESAIENEA